MVLRQAGKYLEEQIWETKRNFLISCWKAIAFASFLIWVCISDIIIHLFLNQTSYFIRFLELILLFILFFQCKILKKQEKEMINSISKKEKWLQGEKEIEYQLSLLQWKYEGFYFINDFQFEDSWNIDHIIICQKWVYIIEDKNVRFLDRIETKKQMNRSLGQLRKVLDNHKEGIFITLLLCNIKKELNSHKLCDYIHSVDPSNIDIFIKYQRDILSPKSASDIYKKLLKTQQ